MQALSGDTVSIQSSFLPLSHLCNGSLQYKTTTTTNGTSEYLNKRPSVQTALNYQINILQSMKNRLPQYRYGIFGSLLQSSCNT